MKSSIVILSVLLSFSAYAGGGSSVGTGNPATINCLNLGGSSEMVDTPQGQYANCVVEEWTLWHIFNISPP